MAGPKPRVMFGVIRRSLMLRVLLPIGVMLTMIVIAALSGVAYQTIQTTRDGLASKATLIADIAGQGLGDALWDLDKQMAKASLAAFTADPDYVGSELEDDKGVALAIDGEKLPKTGTLIVRKVPVFRKQKVVGSLELRLSTARADAAVAAQAMILGITGIGALILILGMLFAILKNATRPIVDLTETMSRLSNGALDIAIPAVNRIDEVGRMAQAVEVFKLNAAEVRQLNDDQARLKQEAEQNRQDLLERMAVQFEATVSSVLTNVIQASALMAERTKGMTTRMGTADDSTRLVTQAANTTLDNIQTVASATEQLSSSINEISNRVNDSATIAKHTSDAAERSSGTIAELAGQAEKIGGIVGLIHNIARQTNLLALNATIEASRAGEAGKGFAVVASEVKSLATQTARATKDIADNIQGIQAVTERAVGEISKITEVAMRSREIATNIANVVEEQSSVTREISHSVSNAAAGTRLVAVNIATVSESITQANGAAHDLSLATNALDGDCHSLETQVQMFVSTIRGTAR